MAWRARSDAPYRSKRQRSIVRRDRCTLIKISRHTSRNDKARSVGSYWCQPDNTPLNRLVCRRFRAMRRHTCSGSECPQATRSDAGTSEGRKASRCGPGARQQLRSRGAAALYRARDQHRPSGTPEGGSLTVPMLETVPREGASLLVAQQPRSPSKRTTLPRPTLKAIPAGHASRQGTSGREGHNPPSNVLPMRPSTPSGTLPEGASLGGHQSCPRDDASQLSSGRGCRIHRLQRTLFSLRSLVRGAGPRAALDAKVRRSTEGARIRQV